jgi:acetolactate synthase I/III small subunit
MKHTISVLVENQFGVLARVAGMFSGRGFNIDTLNVGPTQNPEISRITAVINADDDALDQCIKQLNKLVNVIEVQDYSKGEPFVARELVMLKVSSDGGKRSEIIEIAGLFRAKIINVSEHSIIVECTGNQNKIKAFLGLITPYGVIEMARTGNVALTRKDISNNSEDTK